MYFALIFDIWGKQHYIYQIHILHCQIQLPDMCDRENSSELIYEWFENNGMKSGKTNPPP